MALQEVVTTRGDHLGELGLPWVFGENRKQGGYGYGNVVLSRYPIRRRRTTTSASPGAKSGRAAPPRCEGVTGSTSSMSTSARRSSRGATRAASDRAGAAERRRAAGAAIVLGDFNEWTTGLATRLLRSHMESADVRAHLRRSRTYPGLLPFLHLDHIYYDPALELQKLTLRRSRKALVASDHLPLVADFSGSANGSSIDREDQ